MKRKIIAVSVLVTALLAGGYSAQAGPMGMGCRGQHAEAGQQGCRTQMNYQQEGGCVGHFGRMADDLGLNDSQRQEIEALVAAQQENSAPLMAKIAEGKQQLMEASRLGEIDDSKITGLAEEQGKLMSEMMVSRIQLKSQIFALLTPEQQEKAAASCDECGSGLSYGAVGCGPRCGGNQQRPGAGEPADKPLSM